MFLLYIGSFVILAAQIRKPLDHHRPMYGKLGALRRWRRGYVFCSCIFDVVQKVACQEWMRGKLKMEMIWVKVRKSLKHEYFVWKSSLDHTLFVTEFRALGGLNRSNKGFRSFEEENGSRRKEKHTVTQIDFHRFANIINIISKHVLSPCCCFHHPATWLIVSE